MSAGGNRNVLNREIGDDGKRDWSFDLNEDPRDPPNLCAFWCPCVFYGQNKQRLRHLETHGVPLPGGGKKYNDYCCDYVCLSFFFFRPCLQGSTRQDIRNRYSIRGSFRDDCYTSWCCYARALVQERRELELEENSF
ncbi:PLAC8 family-domain-containing protein [Russula compacta]|nr:PLAC8 family-domain-containing protein [Russula compacta]